MKRVIGIFLLFSFQLISKELISLPENEFSFIRSNGITTFKNVETFGLPGEPNLPVSFLKILIDPNADLKTVKVSLEGVIENEINGPHKIEGAEVPVTTNGLKYQVKGRDIRNSKDIKIYSTNSFYPHNYIRSVNVGKFQAFKVVDIVIQRCKYNPVLQKLVKLENANVVIDYELKRGSTDSYSLESRKIIESAISNKQKLKDYDSSRRATNDYVIITTSSFKSSSQYLELFANIKRNDGFKVKIITESDWGGGNGETAVSNIRAWLISNEPEYVFIIGDPSKNSKIPMVDGPHASSGAPLTDFCYADLNGMYYSNGENRYYEYGVEGVSRNRFDQYPEVHVGRLPVYNGNYNDAEMLLKRMVEYMTEPADEAESYRFSAILPLNTFNDSQNGICFGEELRKRVLDPGSLTYERIYYNHAGTTANFPCSYDSTVSIWNRGKFGLMCLQGHGLSYMAEKAIDNNHVSELTSDGYVHGFNISCHNGKPEDPRNLGFNIMKKVGISQIASAVEIWYSTTTISNYGTKATGNDYAFSYIDNLVNYKKGSGACFTKTRVAQKLVTVNDWQNHVELNLYGCPAIGLYTYGISDQVSINELNGIKKSEKTINIINSSGLIKFKMNIDFNKNSSIEIYNSKGVLVENLTSLNEREVIWNIKESNVSKGVYFVKIKENLKELSATKLIIK